MAIIEIQKTTNLDVTVTADPLHGYTFTNESEGHKFVITGTRSGSPVTLAGVVTARFKRNNKTTVFIAGDKAKIENGKAVVTLLKDCYNVPGRFDFYVYVTSGGATTCVYYGTGTVIQTEEGTLIDSGEAVPSLEELTEVVQNAQAATSEAENVNVTQTKSGKTITLTTTDRNGTTVSNILTDPSGIIASDFDATLSYDAGTYVIYTDGNLYRLTSDHEANVAWSDTGKTKVTIGAEVTDLTNALGNTSPVGGLKYKSKTTNANSLFDMRTAIDCKELVTYKRITFKLACEAGTFPNGYSVLTTNGAGPAPGSGVFEENKWYSFGVQNAFVNAVQNRTFGPYVVADNVAKSGVVHFFFYYDDLDETLRESVVQSALYGKFVGTSRFAVSGELFNGRNMTCDLSDYSGKRIAVCLEGNEDIAPDGLAIMSSNGKHIGAYNALYKFNTIYFITLNPDYAATSSGNGPYGNANQIQASGLVSFKIFLGGPLVDFDERINTLDVRASSLEDRVSKAEHLNLPTTALIQNIYDATAGTIFNGQTIQKDLWAYSRKKVYFEIVCDSAIFPNGLQVLSANGKNIVNQNVMFMPNKLYGVVLNPEFASYSVTGKFGPYASAANVAESGQVLFNLYFDLDGEQAGTAETKERVNEALYGEKLALGYYTSAGNNFNARTLSTDLSEYTGKEIKFIIHADDDLVPDGYYFLTGNGKWVDGVNSKKFLPNTLYTVILDEQFATATASTVYGLYANAADVSKTGYVYMEFYYNPPQSAETPTVTKPLEGKTLWTIWDSLGHNTWQSYFKNITGCDFNANLNTKTDKPISWGGTNSNPSTDSGTQARAMNLVSYKNDYDIDLIIIENINDLNQMAHAGQPTDPPFMRSQKTVIDTGTTSYADVVAYANSHLADILSAVPSASRKKGSILSFQYSSGSEVRGSKVTFTHAPTTAGDISITWGGAVYSVAVTTGMTTEDIAEEFGKYAFLQGTTDTVAGSSITITYYTTTTYRATFNGGSTGVTATVEDAVGGGTYNLYYKGESATDWEDTTKWQNTVSLYSVYKGLLAYLQKELPTAKIYWATPWAAGVDFNASTYKDASGDYVIDKFELAYAELYKIQKAVCEMYGIPVLELEKKSGMSIINVETYFNSNNVHPKAVGYELYARTMANMIGTW